MRAAAGSLAEVMAHLGEQGLTCLVKIDGERRQNGAAPWTLVISGGPLDGHVRREGKDLERIMGEALAELERLTRPS